MKPLLCLLLLSAPLVRAADLPPLDLFRDKEVVATFSRLPVLESGRIKPLETYAIYRLKPMRARSTIWLTENGEMEGKPLVDPATQTPVTKDGGKPVKLSATEWLLMSWFRPDVGRIVPLFTVDNSSAIAELGLKTREKRDQYSFAEIEPAREALMAKRTEYVQVPAKQQTPEQRMIVNLATNYMDYEMILGHFDFIRSPTGSVTEGLPAGVTAPVRLSKSLNSFAAALRGSSGPPMQIPWFRPFFQSALGAMMSGNPERQFRIFPPAPKAVEVWHGPGETIFNVMNSQADATADELKWLANYEDLFLALPNPAKFKAAAKGFVSTVEEAAKARGEGGEIGMELHLLRADYFGRAQWCFLLGLICVALTWVNPGSRFEKAARAAAWGTLVLATVLAVTGVTLRSLIMHRPPITILYETIIFIGASVAVFGLVAEWLTRRGLGLLVTAVGGAACMFLSIQFETSEATDTLQQLQAVLITNFWLSTHVPLINLGYAACMVSALIAMIYFIQRLIGKIKTGDADARFLTRMSYGFIGAGLFLSLVGTVLGGVWANYSWGRF